MVYIVSALHTRKQHLVDGSRTRRSSVNLTAISRYHLDGIGVIQGAIPGVIPASISLPCSPFTTALRPWFCTNQPVPPFQTIKMRHLATPYHCPRKRLVGQPFGKALSPPTTMMSRRLLIPPSSKAFILLHSSFTPKPPQPPQPPSIVNFRSIIYHKYRPRIESA